jgi:hypothetical protein
MKRWVILWLRTICGTIRAVCWRNNDEHFHPRQTITCHRCGREPRTSGRQEERLSHKVRSQIFHFLTWRPCFLRVYRMSRWAELSQCHLVACGKGSMMFITGSIIFVQILWAFEADAHACRQRYCTVLYYYRNVCLALIAPLSSDSSASFQFNEQWFGSSGKCPSSSCSCHFLLLFKYT